MIFHSPELHNIPLHPLHAAGKDTHPHPALSTAPEEAAHRRPGTVQSTPNIFALAHRQAPKQRVRRGSNHNPNPGDINPSTTTPTHKHGYESDSTLALLTSGRRTFPSPPLSPKLAPAANIEQLLESREHRVPKALRVQPVWPDNMRTRRYSRQVRVFLGEYRALRRARPAHTAAQAHTPTPTPAPRNTAAKHTHSTPASPLSPAEGPRTRRRSSTHGKRPAAEQWQVPRAAALPAPRPRPRAAARPRPKAKAPPLKTHAHSNARPQASALAHAAHLASAEVVSRVPMYVPRESWRQLPDYAPATENIPRDRVDALRVEWHGAPTDLSQDPLRALLHPAELALAQTLRLPCDLYLDSKRRLFLEKVYRMRRGMPFRRTDAQKACRIDVNKASRLFAAFERVGWLNDANFAKYL